MINRIFEIMTNALYMNWELSILAAFVWGILSIILSPCHLSTLPLIIGFISGQKDLKTKRAFQLSLLFALGILVTMTAIGIITSMLGKLMGDIGSMPTIIVGAVMILLGIFMLDAFTMPSFLNMNNTLFQHKGHWAAFIIGLIFGIGLGPCAFAYMAPILALSFEYATKSIVYAIGLSGAFIIGHCTVLVLAGTFSSVVESYLHWNDKSRGTTIVKRVCGILIIIGGIYLIIKELL